MHTETLKNEQTTVGWESGVSECFELGFVFVPFLLVHFHIVGKIMA